MSIGLADIFASVRLDLDTGKFEADALKSTTLVSGKMGGILKKAAGGALGAAVGMAFASATRGALELDDAMSKLQADTGMTADEAKAASKAMVGLFKDNLQSFDEIGAAMAAVHNDLGLVGEAATKATAEILKFSTATGIDAAKSVTLLDDALDNWGLTAADAQMVMDKVIVSHQKWGGAIDKNLVTLAKVAPAMRAANFEIDDGIALLGIFGAKGLDSERAAAAFAKALTKVKSPAELQALITDISNTKDPFQRAAKAADLFGAKAGAQLANALGGTYLDDYKVSITEAAGATVKAADAIENSLGNRVKMAIKGFNGQLAELGANTGDLAMVAALLGPGLAKGAFALAGAAAGTAFAGSLMSAASAFLLSPAGALAAVVAVPLAVNIIPAWQYNGKPQTTAEITGEWQNQVNALLPPSLQAGESSGQAFLDGYTSVLAQSAPNAAPAAKQFGQSMGASVLDGYRQVAPAQVAAEDVVKTFGLTMRGVKEAAQRTGADGMAALAAGITAARQKPLDAFDTLKEMLKNAMTPMGEIARLHGEMTSKALARGLRSGDPAVRAQAVAVAKTAADRLGALAEGGGKAGRAAMRELHKGMRSKLPEVRAASKAAHDAAMSKLDATKGDAAAAGTRAGNAFVRGLKGAINTGDFKISGSMRVGLKAMARGGPAMAGQPIIVGEKRPELFVPEVNGYIMPSVPAAQATSGGGGSARLTINVSTPVMTPGSAQALADAIAPSITRWQQVRGL